MPVETEAKMKVESFDAVRRRLGELGARRVGEALETNQFFDTPDRNLLAADKGLRLRTSRDVVSGRERHVITVKGAQQAGEIKSREEAEVEVTDAEDARGVLVALGYEPTLSFEKRRESWKLDDCKIELDELPLLGRFLEIEGDREAVMRLREKLNLAGQPLIKTPYIKLLSDELQKRGDRRREIKF